MAKPSQKADLVRHFCRSDPQLPVFPAVAMLGLDTGTVEEKPHQMKLI
jgi:hypothetical protein